MGIIDETIGLEFDLAATLAILRNEAPRPADTIEDSPPAGQWEKMNLVDLLRTGTVPGIQVIKE